MFARNFFLRPRAAGAVKLHHLRRGCSRAIGSTSDGSTSGSGSNSSSGISSDSSSSNDISSVSDSSGISSISSDSGSSSDAQQSAIIPEALEAAAAAVKLENATKLEAAQQAIGYRFERLELLEEALLAAGYPGSPFEREGNKQLALIGDKL